MRPTLVYRYPPSTNAGPAVNQTCESVLSDKLRRSIAVTCEASADSVLLFLLQLGCCSAMQFKKTVSVYL